TTLVYVNTRDGLDAGVPAWSSAAGSVPVIAWAGGQTAAAQVAYTPWAQLAAPVYAPGQDGVALTPIPGQPVVVNAAAVNTGVTPIAPGVLTVGALATVNTTDGDQLNIRLGPGLNYEIAAKLNDGARVTLVEGPLSADGYVWWKIRTASGIVGWAVESVEENGARLQTLIPG
ncbi:MAG: SH3 domain-containing protein, partial [Anaerolineae bacterium]|nr:SH3 domain-containing protein [Anaerolineae bacterium]